MQRIGIVATPLKKSAVTAARELKHWLESRNIKVFLSPDIGKIILSDKSSRQIPFAEIDLILSLGGDGTLLSTAAQASPHNVPILAIDLGGLGFLSTVTLSRAKDALKKIIAGNYTTENRMMVQVRIMQNKEEKQRFVGLNEVLFHRGDFGKLVHLRTYIGRRPVTTYSADGLIIATPTGSTAYSLSAGGPIISPSIEGFVITPICPHALSARPLVISASEHLRLENLKKDRPVTITMDGKNVSIFKAPEYVLIEKAPYTTKLIFFHEHFYKRLKSKLKWAGEYKRMEL